MTLAADLRRLGALLVERRLAPRARRECPAVEAEVLVHFPDAPVNLYQLRQWYRPLERLAEQLPVTLLVRSARVALLARTQTHLPVVFAPGVVEVERLVRRALAVLYVNQSAPNFQALRFPEPVHVFLNHGESDKAYMVSNQVKAYDHVLVAGEAAARRLRAGVRGIDPARVHLVGRPQVDVDHPAPSLPPDGRTTVLYAPTWEGDRPSDAYSSVASHGEAIVRSLLASGRYRVVFRPHPRTGQSSRAAAAAVRRIARILRAEPGHVVDLDGPFGWHLRAAEACVTDVSATVYDWLATGRPVLVTRPVDPGAWLDPEGVAGRLPLLDAVEAGRTAQRLDALLAAPPDGLAELVREHLGDTTPGAATARFCETVRALVEERRREVR